MSADEWWAKLTSLQKEKIMHERMRDIELQTQRYSPTQPDTWWARKHTHQRESIKQRYSWVSAVPSAASKKTLKPHSRHKKER